MTAAATFDLAERRPDGSVRRPRPPDPGIARVQPPDRLALAPQPSGAARRVLPAALDGHGPGRRGRGVRPRDRRPDQRDLRPARRRRLGQGRRARALDRRADAATSSTSARSPASATTPGPSSTRRRQPRPATQQAADGLRTDLEHGRLQDRRRRGDLHPRPRRQRSGCRRSPEDEGTSQAERAVLRRRLVPARPSRTSTPRRLTNRPTITVATPLFDQNGGGQRVAVLAANLSLARLDRIVQQRTGLGETGRTYLVGPDRRLIQRRRPQLRRASCRLPGDPRGPSQRQDGQGLYADDRGVPVIGVYRWLGDRGAGLIAEISQDEAFGRPGSWPHDRVVGLASASCSLAASGSWLAG